MSDKTKKFEQELDSLIQEGKLLLMAMEYECHEDEFKREYLKGCGGNKKKLEDLLKKIPNFTKNYQSWYSKAQSVIKHVMPDRLADFVSYFEIPKGRKDITYQNYMIRDYLQGLRVTRGWDKEVVVDAGAAIPEFRQQLVMLEAAKATLGSSLMDLKAVLQADLFDSEIESAAALAKAGYARAAGAICGVVIEKHLLHVCDIHGVVIRKKNPAISDLNQLLKEASITTVPQWRFIQHLADIRNICDHAKGREPTKDEIDDLLAGTEKVLKTVF